jgi:DNA-binding transcriptional ArsR family regulator
MCGVNRQQATDIIRAVDEDLVRKALLALLDFAVHPAYNSDEAMLRQVTDAIESLQTYIGFPMPAGAAMRHFTKLLDAGGVPIPTHGRIMRKSNRLPQVARKFRSALSEPGIR